MGSHSNKFNSLRYSFVRVLFKQLIIKMMKSPFSPSPFLRLSLLSQRLKHPLTHTMVMLDMVMVMVDMVVGMVMVFMADTDTTLAKDPLMLMLKPAQLCSMVPMDTHIITESTNCTSVKPKLMLPQTHTAAMPDTVMVMVMDTHTHTAMAVTTEPEPTDTVVMADTDTVMAVN